MNKKIIIAMLIAVFMVVPCAAAMEVTAVVTDDDSNGLAVGDAWGISYSMTKDELIGLLLDDGGPDLDILDLDVPDSEDEMYTVLNEAITNAELDVSFIVEVTRANASGYTISIDGGIRLKLSAEYNEKINFLTLIELPFNIDGNVDAIILMNGLVNLDKNYMITGANLNLDLLIDADVTTNLSMMKFIEYMEYFENEDPEAEAVYLKDIFTEEDNTSKLKMGASASFIMYPMEEAGMTSSYNDENFTTSYIVNLESKQSINASVFVNISGELVEAIKYLDEEGDFEKYIVEDAIQASFAIFETENEDFGFEIDVIKISDNDDGTSKYEFRLNDSYLGTGDLLTAEVPVFETPADLDVNRDGKYYLDGAKKTDVRNNINSIRGSYNDSVSSLIFTVTYTVDEKETQEVSYNGLINPPKVEDIVDDKKFIGWYNEDGDEWNPHWGVKSDLMLSPIYAKNHTTVDELFLHMASNTHGYMKIDGATNLIDFESANFKFDGTMIVDVYDGNKFLYSWKINNDNMPLGDTVMKLNIDKKDLTDDQRKKLADNRQSNEGNFIYINFGASGQMPGRTTVTYNVSDTFENGTALQIYYAITDVDGEIIGFEPVREVNVVDGNVVFDIDHCSGYVLSEMIVSDSGNDNTLLYIGIVVAAIILIIVAAVFVMRSRSRSA